MRSLEGKRILFVDDDLYVRRFTYRMLAHAGAICLLSTTQVEAMDIAQREPDLALVILDFQMADGDIRRLVDHLRVRFPELPLIGTSASNHRDEFAARGVPLFVEKPWAIATLVRELGW